MSRNSFCPAAIQKMLGHGLPLDEREIAALAEWRDHQDRRNEHFEARWSALFRERRATAPRSPRWSRIDRLMRRADEAAYAAFVASERADARLFAARRYLEWEGRYRDAEHAARDPSWAALPEMLR